MGKPYFILRDGKLSRKENTILFENSDVRRSLPLEDVDEIFVLSEVSLTSKLLKLLAQKGVPLHLFNRFGFYAGSFYPREVNESGFLIVRQVEHYLNEEKRLYLAKVFVLGALENLSYVYGIDPAVYLKRLSEAGSIEEIMGVEAGFRRECFKELEKQTGFEFVKRTRKPPENHLNALLSFGNSLVYAKVLGEIYFTPLNPTVSYLHEPSTKRFSLALDVAEVFKPVLSDMLILRLLKEGRIDRKHFRGESGMVFLNEEGKRIFVTSFNELLERTLRNRRLKRKVSLRGFIRIELYRLIKHLIGDEIYEPFVYRRFL